MNQELIKEAEKAVVERAAEIAFKQSNDVDRSDIQSFLFSLAKDYIILGARLMQEELSKIEDLWRKETES